MPAKFINRLLAHINPSPSNPWLQVQMKLPTVSVQVAFVSQTFKFRAHSSASGQETVLYKFTNFANRLLVQLIPSPTNPWLQVQMKLPTVSVQAAFVSQMFKFRAHSSTSGQETVLYKFTNFANRLLVQLIPSPSNPWLQVQMKLPSASVQAAFVSQLSMFNAHSSKSIQHSNKVHTTRSMLDFFTCTSDPVSFETRVAGTVEAFHSVSTSSRYATVVCGQCTFIFTDCHTWIQSCR